jgi:cytochrome c oxidase subunit 3
MPVPTATEELEIIIENIGGGGGGIRPPSGDGGDGDPGKNPPADGASGNRYLTGIALAIVSILVFFTALVTIFLVRKGAGNWAPVHLPLLIWTNTGVLLTSSATLEIARRRLARLDDSGFRRFWLMTTALGVLFLSGQILVWRQLAAQGVFIATNPASSFFYIFTGAHAIHLFGGVGALTFVALRKAEKPGVSLAMAAMVTGCYWHFMDGLWVFLLTILSIGKAAL